MEHPFMPDISGKSVEELQTAMTDLTGKLTFAYRMQNQPLVQQLQMVIEGYKKEYTKKMNEIFDKQNIQNKINIK
jgi:hypothetical protein